MSELNRGRIIQAYFATRTNKPSRLFGAEWLHSVQCGTFINKEGKVRAFTFFLFYEDELDDSPDFKTKESLDIDMVEADGYLVDPIIGDLIKGIPLTPEKLATLDDTQVACVVEKYSTGIRADRPMVDRDLIKLSPNYLGKTFKQSVKNRPNIWQPIVDAEAGLEIPNIWPCSWEQFY